MLVFGRQGRVRNSRGCTQSLSEVLHAAYPSIFQDQAPYLSSLLTLCSKVGLPPTPGQPPAVAPRNRPLWRGSRMQLQALEEITL